MSFAAQTVIGGPRVILPPKPKQPKKDDGRDQFKVRLPRELIADIRLLAKMGGYDIQDATEALLRWSVERAKAEYESEAESVRSVKKHKHQ